MTRGVLVDTLVDELYESWLNGNKTHVIQRLLRIRPKSGSILVAVKLFDKLDEYNRDVLIRILGNNF